MHIKVNFSRWERQKFAQVRRGLIFSNLITLALVLHYTCILNRASQPMNHLRFPESIKTPHQLVHTVLYLQFLKLCTFSLKRGTIIPLYYSLLRVWRDFICHYGGGGSFIFHHIFCILKSRKTREDYVEILYLLTHKFLLRNPVRPVLTFIQVFP